MYFASPDQIYMYQKNEEWYTHMHYCFVAPVIETDVLKSQKEKELVGVVVDPTWDTADVNNENNMYPRRIIPSRVEAYKSKRSATGASRDIMQDIKTKLKTDEDKDKKKKESKSEAEA